ncbi:SCO2400 family protein [Streptomyces cadmiisoli]|uniref:SCO2400 family protein n=1 Tax=Streptomyces cadmiisoli TaxID=2184053 RepID=UPI003D748AD4
MDYWRMDYCSSCRRHLNGALVCPGCGAYAPDIAPVPADRAPAREPDPEAVSPAEADEAISAPGRAARRRQRARWKKSRRKAVVATAVALVGGGLTFTAMDRHSGDRAQAATAPEEVGLGAAERPAGGPSLPSVELPGTSPSTAPPAADPERERSAASTGAADRARQDTAATPSPTGATGATGATAQTETVRPSLPLVPRQNTGSSSSDGTTPATDVPSAEPSAPSDGGDTDPGTSPADPAPSTPPSSPSSPGLCLLVICLG